MAMPNVTFMRPELRKLLPQYELIEAAVAGEPTVKAAKTKYLPMPDAEDTSPENKARYIAYLLRAVFYNVTRRTLSGLIGQVFMREPVVKVPSLLETVVSDASGGGVSLVQQAKRSLSLTLAYSRSGLLVDYPKTAQGSTIADLEAGNIRPTIKTFQAKEIINWRVIQRGSKEVLSLVVLDESYCNSDDGFEMKNSRQYRVLKLVDNKYVQEIWRENIPTDIDTKTTNRNYRIHEVIEMTGSNGEPLDEILFQFLGTENNDTNVDNPNMYDLASINMAHYRNSADYEEACFILGQPTVAVMGISEEWFKTVLGGVIRFGSRGGIPLPVGGDVKLLQAEENTMIKEAMETKERQMVALGAKLVEQKEVQRTAFETKVEATSEGSILSSTTKNVTAGYLWALKWCARLVGQPEDAIEFELNTDFDIARMAPDEQAQLIDSWQKGAITFTEMRQGLRKAGVATEDDKAAKAEIDADQQAKADLEVKKTLAMMPPVVPKI